MSFLDCRVVLVRTQNPGNLGSTARVMRNFGLRELVLVAPEANRDDREARKLSTHGEAILTQARIVGELGEAVADCVLVAATSARTGRLIRGQYGTPDAILGHLVRAAGPVAIVFGPEKNGLTDDEITRCHHLIHIPADQEYPALNLSQAVTICLYELRRAGLTHPDRASIQPPASFAELEQMFTHLRTALEQIHFLYGPKADSLMHAIRHLVAKAEPSSMEVGILHGLARQIQWYALHHGQGEL